MSLRLSIIKKMADIEGTDNTLRHRLLKKRIVMFDRLYGSLPRPIRILDVGGTHYFWQAVGLSDVQDVEITILNKEAVDVGDSTAGFRNVVGDARCMPEFGDNEFDIVVSNSCIEHVGDFENQGSMACEIARVGKRLFLQTPNFWYPFEPHFFVPCFQFLPISWRVFLLRHFKLGLYGRVRDKQKATELVREIRLLTRRELRKLFPDAMVVNDRFLGLTYSFIVYTTC